MKLCQFTTKDSEQQKLGLAIDDDMVCDVAACARAVKSAGGALAEWLLGANGTLDVIRRGGSGIQDIASLLEGGSRSGQGQAYSPDSIEFLPATYPRKILAIGRNYAEHASEGGADLPKAPLLFNKLPNALSAHNAQIILPSISEQVDFEAELAVVIGTTAKQVSAADAFEQIFGYSLINDVSARDLQFGDVQ